jgi:hypothetical protein
MDTPPHLPLERIILTNNISLDSTLDTLENNMIEKLEEFQTSHPNIVILWKEYIKIKRINFMKAIIDCETMIDKLSETRDIAPETIVLLYALFAR